MLHCSNCETYNYNGEDIPFDELPELLKIDILQAEDFWRKLDNAITAEELQEIIENHPANN